MDKNIIIDETYLVESTNFTLNEYQRECLNTAVFPNIGNNILYPVMKLVGEAGEVSEKIAKWHPVIGRDGDKRFKDKIPPFSEKQIKELIKELGDVMWYAAMVSFELRTSLERVGYTNIHKLNDRKTRNKLQGSGDNR